MKINTIFGEAFLNKGNSHNYHNILSRWFYIPFGSGNLAVKPKLLYYPTGFKLNGSLIRTILSTRDEYEMWTTDADAILANFFFFPGNYKLKQILSIPGKPIIISIDFSFITTSGILKLAEKIESFGAAGLYVNRTVSARILRKISSVCRLPLFAASPADFGEIKSKISSGVYGVCIPGKYISSETTAILHQKFPHNPVIAVCSKSETQIQNSIKSGSDAFIFRPCVPFV